MGGGVGCFYLRAYTGQAVREIKGRVLTLPDAKKELGGGAALTLSHDLDLALWIMNSNLQNHSLLKNFSSGLEVDVDSAADFILGFENGATGHVHLNFFQKVARREYRYEFSEASVTFNFFKQELEVVQKKETNVFILENFERNDLFISQTQDFFSQIETFTLEQSLNNIQEAARVVALCEPF